DGFSLITLLISCLGLFGLAAYSAERRTKEIGIRKVMGANVSQLAALLSTEFIVLVLISMVVAVPLVWLGMTELLNHFAYRIRLDWWIFALTCVVAVLTALATVSFQAIRAAMANPVKSLRTE
ncbi:MAG TPA: FtsX-like permease family protein, partial [Ferruginibacter sp.]|nr:FtsX-like permease family protein [Ferruginibacter sp.]